MNGRDISISWDLSSSHSLLLCTAEEYEKLPSSTNPSRSSETMILCGKGSRRQLLRSRKLATATARKGDVQNLRKHLQDFSNSYGLSQAMLTVAISIKDAYVLEPQRLPHVGKTPLGRNQISHLNDHQYHVAQPTT